MLEIKWGAGENSNLPICPKCNDTKFVSRPITIKLDSWGDYYCSNCDLLWHRTKPYIDRDWIDRR